MPINEKEMKALKKEYWAKKWEQVYYALENKKKKKEDKWLKDQYGQPINRISLKH